MSAPILSFAGWSRQNHTTSTSRTRAQAFDEHGDEGRHAYHGTVMTETADFSASDETAQKLAIPQLGDGISSWVLTFSNTAFPALSVTKASNVKGSAANPFNEIPNQSIGVPAEIFGVTDIGNCKQAVITGSAQTVSDHDGDTWIGKMYDMSITMVLTGIEGKPTWSGDGWEEESDSSGTHNTALDDGSVTLVKHFKASRAA